MALPVSMPSAPTADLGVAAQAEQRTLQRTARPLLRTTGRKPDASRHPFSKAFEPPVGHGRHHLGPAHYRRRTPLLER